MEEFANVSATKCIEIDTFLGSPHVTTYLKRNWFTYAELWVNFGRNFYHCSSETKSKAERYLSERVEAEGEAQTSIKFCVLLYMHKG